MSDNIPLGRRAEDAAAEFLKRKGYKILVRNYRCCVGEIDIVAQEKGVLCFVEVKARSSDACGSPQDAISVFKKKRLSKAALFYLAESGSLDRPARFDVVAVLGATEGLQLELFCDAFDLEE